MSSKLNLSVNMNVFGDPDYSNMPTLNYFKWHRNLIGQSVDNPKVDMAILLPNEEKTIFDTSVALSSDLTTTWNLSLKVGSSSQYILSHNSGTAPLFRTPRDSGIDATSVITITKNAKLLTLTVSAGTIFDLISGGVIVGDEIRLGSLFNALNQGVFKILSRSSTYLTIENEIGVAESDIDLGSGFAEQLNIYSNSGVQIGDTLDIYDGFFSSIYGSYTIDDVSHNYIVFTSLESLPMEDNVPNLPSLAIYINAKKIIYLEANNKLSIKLNGDVITNTIVPNDGIGILLTQGILSSLKLVNTSSVDSVEVLVMSVE